MLEKGVVDIVQKVGYSYVHKQIEFRNGLVFMRLKKRRLVSFS